jgi:hypothetical protein
MLVLLSLLSLSSCCSLRKTKTITTTTTITHLDTIIQVAHDTIWKFKSVPITDTVYISNTVAEARAYILSPGRLAIELKGKVFNEPVRINQTKTVATKTKVFERKTPFGFYVFCFTVGIVIPFLFYYLKKKK